MGSVFCQRLGRGGERRSSIQDDSQRDVGLPRLDGPRREMKKQAGQGIMYAGTENKKPVRSCQWSQRIWDAATAGSVRWVVIFILENASEVARLETSPQPSEWMGCFGGAASRRKWRGKVPGSAPSHLRVGSMPRPASYHACTPPQVLLRGL